VNLPHKKKNHLVCRHGKANHHSPSGTICAPQPLFAIRKREPLPFENDHICRRW
jgi:hypothetical protein